MSFVSDNFLSYGLFASLIPLFRFFLAILHTLVSPAVNAASQSFNKERTFPVSQGLLVEYSLTDLIIVTLLSGLVYKSQPQCVP